MDTISARINVSKINKEKLFDGKTGKLLDIILIPTENNQYGNDYMVVESATQEERARGERGTILGNAKILRPKPKAEEPFLPVQDAVVMPQNDGLPF